MNTKTESNSASEAATSTAQTAPSTTSSAPAFDDFGLPIKAFPKAENNTTPEAVGEKKKTKKEEIAITHPTTSSDDTGGQAAQAPTEQTKPTLVVATLAEGGEDASADLTSDSDDGDFKDAQSEIGPESQISSPVHHSVPVDDVPSIPKTPERKVQSSKTTVSNAQDSNKDASELSPAATATPTPGTPMPPPPSDTDTKPRIDADNTPTQSASTETKNHTELSTVNSPPKVAHSRDVSQASITNGTSLSEFSHQQLSTQQEEEQNVTDDGGWQEMPSFARFDMYNDDDKLIARERNEEEETKDNYGYGNLGGAGKGYTRVLMDEDAQSATSMDENTQYLFKEAIPATGEDEDDQEARDAVGQMQATKDLLTEGQRIAYVGIVRLEIAKLVKESEDIESTKKIKKLVATSAEATRMWGQKMMLRLHAHMDISEAEQVMIEQLAEHGVQPSDLTPALMANSRVHNPMAAESRRESIGSSGSASHTKSPSSPVHPDDEEPAEPPPPYEVSDAHVVPDTQTPSQLPTTAKIDIDLRWTVLCDLFLILVADSIYDARSRVLLERVGKSLDVEWIDICKFERRITDALEMQQAAEKENWNEDEHMEERRKKALKKRYVMMGLATVGGGLVIGLSAGLLAPVIGAGLAAGFTTIGVGGTSSFLAGAGGAAIITSSAAASGSLIGGRAANRRTGAVKTFEYRPLHNNKRVNLIVTVSGWLTGKMDDVRLPFSTVDSIMGDIYSVLWEPEMLRSMGDTINILATEALTQGLQQILGSTILVSLMAALQLPLVLTKLSYLIDNPWAVSLDRATAAGLILADSIIERNLGTRPITLVGYSLGSRVIFSCLQELAKKGAYGLVQNAYMFGSPIVVKKDEYLRARTVVSGRFVNGFNRNDWILGYLFRLTNGGIRRVAGLGAIEEAPWIENIDVTDIVKGHMEYRTSMPTLLLKCGWDVTSEEFSEIEDPDPENHQERQRELINEIEEARKEMENKEKASKGSRFSLFGRRKKADRQEWEVYEDSAMAATAANAEKGDKAKGGDDGEKNDGGVLFDIDAIRAELRDAKEPKELELLEPELEQLQIREIESTLPPMKLDISPVSPSSSSASPIARNRNAALRETQSVDVLPMRSVTDTALFKQKKTSTLKPFSGTSLSAYHSEPDYPEDEIQMTFDTSFDSPMSPYANGTTTHADSNHVDTTSSQTLPNMKMVDPWADPDDEAFGQEQEEISMTFA